MVIGAGLAMATMDHIQYAAAARPISWMWAGGATQEQIEHAFEILLSDANVKASSSTSSAAFCALTGWPQAW